MPVSPGLSNGERGRAELRNATIDTPSVTGQGTVSGSPLPSMQRESSWPTEGLENLHLSSHEPRYFPGMMARASRRQSARRSSAHESDDAVSARNHLKKASGREDTS